MSLDRDLETFAQLGTALWIAPERARPVVIETLGAVSLLELSEDRALERAAMLMLARAESRGNAEGTLTSLASGQFGNPFFKLAPSERFILVALHSGRWSYERVARVMNLDADAVERFAWKSRVRLGAAQGILPAGPKTLGTHCPEYDFERPWTQRFLDEEIPNGRERIFLQNHLMACSLCQNALNRCRDLYFRADKAIPKDLAQEDFVRELSRIRRRGLVFRRKSLVTFRDGLLAMLRQRDIQLWLALAAALLFYRYFR
ncbi:MAG: hypothetical protein P4M08_15170 [Oligoflexia bacterium]|nr:hypothetical protein [Oligoflexia bacterium]